MGNKFYVEAAVNYRYMIFRTHPVLVSILQTEHQLFHRKAKITHRKTLHILYVYYEI